MTNENETDVPRNAATIVTCMLCQIPHEVCFEKTGWMRWRSGEHIQVAMPYLNSNEREILISRICGRCFDHMHEGGDDDEMA
jgi:hypothetical protein